MFDVLIIGSGGAGLCAALSAKNKDKKVLVVSKTYPTHSQTVQAQGGINAVLNDKEESILMHINDTNKAAHGLASKVTIKNACKNAKSSIEYLNKIGVPFSRDKNYNIKQRMFGASTQSRTCYSSDYTGLKILHTLYDETIKQNISYLNEHMLLNILIKDNKAVGISVLDIENSCVKQILSKTIILATGGYCNLYNNHTTNSNQTTGDGQASALRAGVELSNMEFIQFHPTAMKDSNILISESSRGDGGYLLGADKKRFVDELEARDVVARAINKKILKKEEVYLDLRHLGLKKIQECLPQERALAYQYAGIKLEEDLLSINPAAHYSMGGIKTTLKGETNIENLYAVGECAQNGFHGANRIGGNSLLEIVYFGRLIGEEAAKKAAKVPQEVEKEYKVFLEDKENIDAIFLKKNEINLYEKKSYLGTLFFNNFGLIRNEKDMLETQAELSKLRRELSLIGICDKSRVFNKNLQEYLEFENLLEIAFVVSTCCINRKESRGSHYREDYKQKDKNYQKNSLIYQKDSNLIFSYEQVL